MLRTFSKCVVNHLFYASKKFTMIPRSGTFHKCAAIEAQSSFKKSEDYVEERKINVDGININYVKTGTGNHPVMLLCGAMGTIWTDFKPQIDNLDKQAFTIVAWDPPGYGKSRPPDRDFPVDFFQRDATWARNLMHALGFNKFSLIGWSDGGITSLLIASTYPESIRKMVVFGANSYVLPQEMKLYESVRNIDKWSEKVRKPLLEIYGDNYFRKTWSDWIDTIGYIFENQGGDLCKNDLTRIKCPTLIIHGTKDILVDPEHPIYLKEHIKNARLHMLENGPHNLHLKYHKEFNDIVTLFLQENFKY